MIRTLQRLMTDAGTTSDSMPVFKQTLLNEINLIRHAVRLHLNRPLVEEDKARITIRGNFTDGYKIYHGNTFIKAYTWQEAREYRDAIAAAIDQVEKVVVDNATASMSLENWARQQEFMEGRMFERPRNTGKNQHIHLRLWIDATTELLTIDLLEKHLGRKPLLEDYVKVVVEKKRANVGDIPEIVLVNYDKQFIGRIIFEKLDEMGYGAKMETAEEAYKALRSDYTADAHAARQKEMEKMKDLIGQKQVYVKTDAAKISKLFDTDAIRGQADHLADAFAYAIQSLHNNLPFYIKLEAEQRKDKRWQRIFAALVIANIILWWPLIFGL